MRVRAKAVIVVYRDSNPVQRRNLGELVSVAREVGYAAIVLAPHGTTFLPREVDESSMFHDAANSREEILEQVASYARRYLISRIWCTSELDVESAARVRLGRGLPGLQPEQAIGF